MTATQPMLDVGVSTLLDEMGTGRPPWLTASVAVDLVSKVYTAMAAVAPTTTVTRPFVLRLDTSELQAQLREFTETVAAFKAAVESATEEEVVG